MLALDARFPGRDDLIPHSPVVAIPELPVFLLDNLSPVLLQPVGQLCPRKGLGDIRVPLTVARAGELVDIPHVAVLGVRKCQDEVAAGLQQGEHVPHGVIGLLHMLKNTNAGDQVEIAL